MEVHVKLGGRMLTGEERFLITEHSGAPVDLPDVVQDEITEYSQSLLDGGDWVMIVDDRHYLIDAGDHPDYIRVSGEVRAGILNEWYSADDEFVVVGHGDSGWTTMIDGEVTESGHFHPFLIEAGMDD